MDFTLENFVNELRNEMYKNFPYDPTSDRHIRDMAFGINGTIRVSDNEFVFEIGNNYSEREMPYYHILEDAQVITKSGRATKQTKGSQANVKVLQDRDYGKVVRKERSGKVIYSQEYRKNVNGKRSLISKAQSSKIVEWQQDGKIYKYRHNSQSKYYVNIHYHYIENMLKEKILDNLANMFSLKRKRTQITSLETDYYEQLRGFNE